MAAGNYPPGRSRRGILPANYRPNRRTGILLANYRPSVQRVRESLTPGYFVARPTVALAARLILDAEPAERSVDVQVAHVESLRLDIRREHLLEPLKPPGVDCAVAKLADQLVQLFVIPPGERTNASFVAGRVMRIRRLARHDRPPALIARWTHSYNPRRMRINALYTVFTGLPNSAATILADAAFLP